MFLLNYKYRINISNISFYTPIEKYISDDKLSYGIKFIFNEPMESIKEDIIFFESEDERNKQLDFLDKKVNIIKLL